MRKYQVIILMICLISLTFTTNVVAISNLDELQNDEINILIVYSTDGGEITPLVKKLDLLASHFTNNVRSMNVFDLQQADVYDVTHVIYIGESKQDLSDKFIRIINRFSGSVIGIGYNAKQFKQFRDIKVIQTLQMNAISSEYSDKEILKHPIYAFELKDINMKSALLYGYKGETDFPLLMKVNENDFYFAVPAINEELGYYFAEALHEMLPNNHTSQHLAYLRLEDIHPLTDPVKLQEIGDYLNERDIPFIMSIIPIYINPETEKKFTFGDSPELLKVIKKLQNLGGAVVAHGYTHQYRLSETGEGYEFWDVVNNQFIIESDSAMEVEEILTKNEFTNEASYTEYINELKAKEERYVRDKLDKAIYELVSYDLYPLGFEAPHYSMSEQGYQLVSDNFSAIFGHVQLSDKDWQVVTSVPYVTSASFLTGLHLYPDTIGFVNSTLEYPIQQINRTIQQKLLVRDSIMGGYYHPFLGLDYLPELIEQYEKIPNIKWFNLKETEQQTKTTKIEITTDETGVISVVNEIGVIEGFIEKRRPYLLENILWGITLVVGVFILIFSLFILRMRIGLKKKLFEERTSDD